MPPSGSGTITPAADFATMSGVPVEPVYGPDDGEFPGQYPFTRGPHASMYRSKLWTMRMFAGFGTALDTNRRFHDLHEAQTYLYASTGTGPQLTWMIRSGSRPASCSTEAQS